MCRLSGYDYHSWLLSSETSFSPGVDRLSVLHDGFGKIWIGMTLVGCCAAACAQLYPHSTVCGACDTFDWTLKPFTSVDDSTLWDCVLARIRRVPDRKHSKKVGYFCAVAAEVQKSNDWTGILRFNLASINGGLVCQSVHDWPMSDRSDGTDSWKRGFRRAKFM